MKMNEERIEGCFEAISRMRPKPEDGCRRYRRARRVVIEAASNHAKRSSLFRVTFWGRGVGIAAVVCVGVGIVLRLLDSGVEIDVASAAFARVMEALESPRILHEVSESNPDDGPYRSELWYDFESRTLLSKYSTDGRCVKISSLNYRTMEDVIYYPDVNEVRIVYRCDVSPDGYPDTASEVVFKELDWRVSRVPRSSWRGAARTAWTWTCIGP